MTRAHPGAGAAWLSTTARSLRCTTSDYLPHLARAPGAHSVVRHPTGPRVCCPLEVPPDFSTLCVRPPCSVRCVERSCHWPGCACCGYHTQADAPAGAAGTWPLHASSTSPVQTVPALRPARRDAWRGAMATATTRSVRHAERAKNTGRAIPSTTAMRQSRAVRRGAPRPFRLSTAANAPAKHATFAWRSTHARTKHPRLKMLMHRHLHRLRQYK